MDWDTVAPLVATADTVFHLAAAVGVRLVVEQPVHTIQTNIGTTETVLALAAERRSRVLLASTSEVYGKLDGHRFSENDAAPAGHTAWWCLGSCSRPFRASHSRCMGTGRSVAPSRGWETS